MNGGLMMLTLLVLIALAVAVTKLRRYHSRQELLKRRIRTSEAYLCLRPLLDRCRTLRVERISLRPDRVVVTLFDPPGKRLQCVFEEHGLDDMEPAPLAALAQAITAELPMLRDNRRYFFKSYLEDVGGITLRWYEYMIQSPYKDAVLRERYDRIDL